MDSSIAAGSMDAIYAEFYLPIYKFILRLCRDQDLAENVAADTFSKYLLNGRADTNERSYLYQIAYHQLIDYRRYEQNHAPLELALDVKDSEFFRPVEKEVELRQAIEDRRAVADEVLSLIGSILSPVEQRVVVLHLVRGHSFEEVGTIMSMTENNAKVRFSRAIASIREKLDTEIDYE